MKKIIKLLLAIVLISPIYAYASGGVSVSPTSLTVEVGSKKTFTIKITNAIGDVDIVSSDTSVATVNKSSFGTGMVEEGQTKSTSVTVTGVSVGTTTITINIDAATFDSEDLSGQKKTVNITVVPKTEKPVTNTNTTNTAKPTTTNNTVTKSTNNNLGSLTIEGYTVEKVDDKNYKLEVEFDATKINVKAASEDAKATVSGDGEHELKVGENNIELKITSESGEENNILLTVTRKDKECPNTNKCNETKNSNKSDTFETITHLSDLIVGIIIGFLIFLLVNKHKRKDN